MTTPLSTAPEYRRPTSTRVPGLRRFPRFRHQLPVVSPISARAIGTVTIGAASACADAPEALTELLRREYHAREAVLCGSGTQALQLAITVSWRKIGRRGSVALPAFACFDLVTAAVGAGVPSSFFDLDPRTLGPDLDSLRALLRRGARVVVVAPLYGIPVAWDEVADLCSRFGAILIEDAAQGQGATWAGRPLGSHGDLAVLSFGRGKGWTGGGGGALLSRDLGLDAAARELRPVGRLAGFRTVMALGAQWAIGRPAVYGLPAALPFLHLGETVYHAPSELRQMHPLAAALALRHRPLAIAAAQGRREIARHWHAALGAEEPISVFDAPDGGEAGYLRYPVLLPHGQDGLTSRAEATRAGIAASYPRILPELDALQRPERADRAKWPGARKLARSLVTLPAHGELTERDRERVLELVRGYPGWGDPAL